MATLGGVRLIALDLPEVEESASKGIAEWRVRGKLVVWERPLRKADREALGDEAPDGVVVCARVADAGIQEMLTASDPEIYFITPHFEGWPGVLVRLDVISVAELRELIVEAWLIQAPKRLSSAWLADSG